jgi:hypothetical protein
VCSLYCEADVRAPSLIPNFTPTPITSIHTQPPQHKPQFIVAVPRLFETVYRGVQQKFATEKGAKKKLIDFFSKVCWVSLFLTLNQPTNQSTKQRTHLTNQQTTLHTPGVDGPCEAVAPCPGPGHAGPPPQHPPAGAYVPSSSSVFVCLYMHACTREATARHPKRRDIIPPPLFS